MQYQLVKKSSNRKTGPIPVSTTSSESCPPSCPFKGAGCYAEAGFFTRLNWRAVDSGERGGSLNDLCEGIKQIPLGNLWRHNQAGDLPGSGERINGAQLQRIVKANRGRRGFTYTHKRPEVGNNGSHIERANKNGFTINLSANNLADADKLAALGIGPVVSVVPESWTGNGETPEGRKVIQCPATAREDITCADCGLCQWATRKAIIAFPAHGPSKRAATEISKEK